MVIYVHYLQYSEKLLSYDKTRSATVVNYFKTLNTKYNNHKIIDKYFQQTEKTKASSEKLTERLIK